MSRNKESLENRENGKFKGKDWYRFGRSQNIGIQHKIKLCVPRLVDKLHASIDFDGTHFLDNVDVGGIVFKEEYKRQSLLYLLAILNSNVARWYFPFVSVPFRGGWLSANRQFLSQVPVVLPKLTISDEKSAHDEIVRLVEKMLALQKERQSVRREDDLDRVRTLEKQIAFIDEEIEKRVYVLYGLTEEEIRIVEGN